MLADVARDRRVGWVRPCAVVQGGAAEEIAGWVLGPWPPRGLAGRRWTPVPLWSGVRAQFVHADDVATAIAEVVARRATGPFNLAAEPVLPAGDVARVLGGFRLPVPRTLVTSLAWASWRAGLTPAHPGWFSLTDRAALVDTARARTELRWQPVHDGVSALTELVAAVRSGADVASPALAGRRGHGRPTHQTQSPRSTRSTGGS
jgi:nucleoside-diphosphate-sugar epimerase